MVISLLALFIGFLIDLAFGDPYSIPHPIRWIGSLIARLEPALRGCFPKTEQGERRAGAALVALVLLVSTALPLLVLMLSHLVHPLARLAAESVMCWQILAAKSLKVESMKVCRALEKGDLEGARYAVSMIVGRDTAQLDSDGITRAAVETVAENASDGVLAPMLYAIIGGAPLGFFYKAANTMDSMVGYKNERYLNFGRAAAKLDDVLNFVPSRLCAILMIAAAWICRLDAKSALRLFRRDRKKHASPNSAQTEAVCAGALGIRLAGDAVYHGTVHKKETIGDDTRPVIPGDIRLANRLMMGSAVLGLLLLGMCKLGVILWTGAVLW